MRDDRLEIVYDGEDRYYVFEDVAGMFWPDNYHGGDNHTAEERIRERMQEHGQGHPLDQHGYYVPVTTPVGPVEFDSESGGFECHASERGPVEYVVSIIRELLEERAKAREMLR